MVTFIRHGMELDTAYEDTLGDEVLGTLGRSAPGCWWRGSAGRRRRDDDVARVALTVPVLAGQDDQAPGDLLAEEPTGLVGDPAPLR